MSSNRQSVDPSVAAKYSALINGYTSAVPTRLDMLHGFETVIVRSMMRV